MKAILPIVGMLVTVIMTLTAVIFCALMGANSTPAQIHTLKLWMAGFSLLGLAGVVVSIFLLRGGQYNWATWIAFAPSFLILIIFVVAVNK
ncbi:MAG TPA: hypothetical protein VM029_00615 [Opitutaceae bacterium]|nr:hypothetical protein [Opitutaceae bacterium]